MKSTPVEPPLASDSKPDRSAGEPLDRLLLRQLRRAGLSPDRPPADAASWRALLLRVSRSYTADKQDRYLLERSLEISSREMNTLYEDLRRSSASEVAAERDKLRAIIDGFSDGFCRLDLDGLLVDANPTARRLLGAALTTSRQPVLERLSLRDGSTPAALLAAVIGGRSIRDEHATLLVDDGGQLPVSTLLYPIRQEGAITGCALFFRDITPRLQAELTRRRLELAVEASADAIYVTDPDGLIQYVNPAFTAICGWTAEAAIGQKPSILRSDETPRHVHRDLWRTITSGRTWRGRLLNRRRCDGDASEHYWAQTTVAPISGDDEKLLGYVAVQRDVTAEVIAERRKEREAELAGLHAGIAEALQFGGTLAQRLTAGAQRLMTLPDFDFDGRWLIAVDDHGKPAPVAQQGEGPPGLDRLLRRSRAEGAPLRPIAETRPGPCLLVPFSHGGKHPGLCWFGLRHAQALDEASEAVLQLAAGMIAATIADEEARREADLARQAALDAASAKSRFLANMSHEIRTPMNGVIGMLDILASTDLVEEQLPYLETARRSADGLMRIIDDILDFSKIEAGKLELEQAPFDVRLAADETVMLYSGRARDKGIQLGYRLDGALEHLVVGDSMRLKQILNNLVDNALKFTERGSVTLRVRQLEAQGRQVRLLFEVQDTGIGMQGSRIEQLFQPFTQADGTTTRRFGGTGLGLAISRELAQLMGGEMGADRTPGSGSVFWIALPFERQDPRAYARRTARFHGLRVLVVDAEDASREVIAHHLTAWGVDFEVCDGADDGMARLHAAADGRPFDIAIVDMRLPGTDGLTLARQIKSTPAISNTRLLMMSADSSCEASLRAAGLRSVIVKPIRQEALQASLGRPGDRHPAPDPAERGARDAPLRGHVLLAEDNPVNQQVAEGLLLKLGLSVDTAGDGLEALQMESQNSYDLILMDCQMPHMDGYEATRRLRAVGDRGGPRPPIVALTANAMAGDRERCLAAGMDDYLAKPIRLEQLRQTLAKWLARE